MANLEPNVPMTIKSSFGVVNLNTVYADFDEKRGWLFQVQNDKQDYSIAPGKLRFTSDSVSQGDGSSIQPSFIDGLVATMTIAYWYSPTASDSDKSPACAETLRLMDEFLMGVLNGLRTFPTDVSTQQYAWTPTGATTNRILEGIMLGPAWPDPDFSEWPPETRRKIQVASPYPYALENAEVVTPIADGDSATVTNPGNISQLPVIFAFGPFTQFAVVNDASGFTVSYDSSRPGAHAVGSSDVLQIDFVEGTCLLNGDPELDYIAGLDPAATDLWPLTPNSPMTPGGAQNITVSGADIEVISFPSWI